MKKLLFISLIFVSFLMLAESSVFAQVDNKLRLKKDLTINLPTSQKISEVLVLGNYFYYLNLVDVNNVKNVFIVKRHLSGATADSLNMGSYYSSNTTNLVAVSGVLLFGNDDGDGSCVFTTLTSNLTILNNATYYSLPLTFSGGRINRIIPLNDAILWVSSTFSTEVIHNRTRFSRILVPSLAISDSLILDSLLVDDFPFCYDFNYWLRSDPFLYLSMKKGGDPWHLYGRIIKINSTNLQIVATGTVTMLNHYQQMFLYNNSLYGLNYLGVEYTSGSYRLDKINPLDLSIIWSKNLGPFNPNWSGNQGSIKFVNDYLLCTTGWDTIYKIDPINGTTLVSKFFSGLGSTGKFLSFISHNGVQYPLMLNTPSSGAAGQYSLALLNPVSLDTSSKLSLGNLSGDYNAFFLYSNDLVFAYRSVKMVKVSGDIFPSLKLLNASNQDISNQVITVPTGFPLPANLVFNPNGQDLRVKNVSWNDQEYKCAKQVISNSYPSPPQATDYFSWDITYPSTAVLSAPLSIADEAVFSGFKSYYQWNNNFGARWLRYTFRNALDANDKVTYEVHYDFIVGQDQPEAKDIKIYPNPAQDYLYLSNWQGESEIFNILGVSVLKAEGQCLEISSLRSGVYYLRLDDGQEKVIYKFYKE